MSFNTQFFWFVMNAVVMCIFILPIAAAFWLSVFAAAFDWSQWINICSNAISIAANEPTKALGVVQTYWGIFSFFMLAAYSVIFNFKVKANKQLVVMEAIKVPGHQ